ncbi:MAG: hypothetical protein K6F34_02475 [Lachnospiraceae bacterium]|nr:hypothetical protein [Lachnospiraceae bacterium]
MKAVRYLTVTILALIHQALTYTAGTGIFAAPASSNITDYVICKLTAFGASWFFFLMLWDILIGKDRKNAVPSRIIKAALPYLAIMIPVVIIKLRSGYLSNDETLIYENAVTLTHYTWFNYMTTYYYIVSLMLIPHMYAPIFVKLFIEYMVIGYTVMRCREHYLSKSDDPFIKKPFKIGYGCLIILLFVLYPVIAYTTSAHRLPVYFLMYLLMIVMLLFDKLEQAALTIPKFIILLLLGAVLTQWRTEGIYLVLLVPILIFLTYDGLTVREGHKFSLKGRKGRIAVIVLYLLLQYVISIPQTGAVANEMGAAADERMKPFYAYTITNMYRNGLDKEKNAADLAIVDKYISLESIEAINDYYGDINYEDVLILYQPGYIGVREDAGVTEYYDFANALKRIFINNPQVFVRTRIGAFVYAALPYHISFTGFSPRALAGFIVSIIKTVSYNIFIPLFAALFLCLYSLARGRWFSFFVTGGLLAHWFIVFVLAPASYFKYYFPVYMTAYLYIFLLIIEGLYNKKHPVKVRMLK